MSIPGSATGGGGGGEDEEGRLLRRRQRGGDGAAAARRRWWWLVVAAAKRGVVGLWLWRPRYGSSQPLSMGAIWFSSTVGSGLRFGG